MVKVKTESCYLKENWLAYGEKVESYLAFLASDGRGHHNLACIRASIRGFLARMPPAAPDGIDAETFRAVAAIMEKDGLNGYYSRMAMLYMGRFMGHAYGRNPFLEIDPRAAPRWVDGHMGEFLFQAELNFHLARLESAGASVSTLTRVGTDIATLCRALERDMGIRSLAAIDGDCFGHLDAVIQGVDPARKANALYNLRRFLRDVAGASPERHQEAGAHATTEEWSEFEGLLDAFIADQTERGLRPRTLSSLRRNIANGYRAIVEWEGPVRVRDIDLHMIRRARLRLDGVKQRTVRTMLCDLGRFVHFTAGHNPYLQADMVWPFEEVRRTWIGRGDWERLWGAADETQRAILALGAGLGMRRAEMAGLKLSDFVGTSVVIRGKGSGASGKVVVKEVPAGVAEAIRAYIPVREAILAEAGDRSEGSLFVMPGRRRGGAASVGFVDVQLRRLRESTGIEFSSHTLRRLYCMTLYDGGMDLDTIRRMMRHEDVQTTISRYLDADPRKLSAAGAAVQAALFCRSSEGSAPLPFFAWSAKLSYNSKSHVFSAPEDSS
ncbi:MAG: site-specific integrase [Candidatus Methanomethylophilaceae archaeon]|nr:site-specific integrase [Candidatus Methanomethylophilaceae archaeon]